MLGKGLRLLCLAALLFCAAGLPETLRAQNVALVIGNAAYRHVDPLANPVNDAKAVVAAFRQQGFDVVQADDLSRGELYDVLRAFRHKADGAEVALVYYAGHGIEIEGRNYLIPVDAQLADPRDAKIEMVSLDAVLDQLSGAKQLKMVVLDACRNNPFVARMQRASRASGVGVGLAMVDSASADTLIAYAAAAGEVTPDGVSGANSPFTTAFVNAMSRPPSDVRIMLGAVRDELRQIVPEAAPFVYSSLGHRAVVINPKSAPETIAQPKLTEDDLLRGYATAEFAGTVEAWDEFLETFSPFDKHMLYMIAQRSRRQLLNAQPGPDRAAAAVAALPAPVVAQPPVVVTPPPAVAEPPSQLQPLPSSDELIRSLQAFLRQRDCYRGGIDGSWGPGSAAGLERFNTAAGISVRVDRTAGPTDLAAALSELERHSAVACPKPSAARPAAPPRPAAVVTPDPVLPAPPVPPQPQVAEPAQKRQRSWENDGYCKQLPVGGAYPNAGC